MYVKRKLVDFPVDLWEKIVEYQSATGEGSAQKAILNLVRLGLKAKPRRPKEPTTETKE
jgi:hypothetical protein